MPLSTRSSKPSPTSTSTPPSKTSSRLMSSLRPSKTSSPAAIHRDDDHVLSAQESLLRLARRTDGHLPPPSASHALHAQQHHARRVASPGDSSWEPLETPVAPYPVERMGIPAFRHEEFGWCANQDFRYTSQVRFPLGRIGGSGLSSALARVRRP